VRITDKGKKAGLTSNSKKPRIFKDEMKIYNEAQISPNSPARFKKQTTEAVRHDLKSSNEMLQKR